MLEQLKHQRQKKKKNDKYMHRLYILHKIELKMDDTPKCKTLEENTG